MGIAYNVSRLPCVTVSVFYEKYGGETERLTGEEFRSKWVLHQCAGSGVGTIAALASGYCVYSVDIDSKQFPPACNRIQKFNVDQRIAANKFFAKEEKLAENPKKLDEFLSRLTRDEQTIYRLYTKINPKKTLKFGWGSHLHTNASVEFFKAVVLFWLAVLL